MRGKKSLSPPLSGEEFALTLHKIAVAGLPNKTPVDTIPALFMTTRGQPFPIAPDRIPAGPDGLASILSAGFSHILSFTQNREGRVFVTPLFPPDAPDSKIMDVHRRVGQPGGAGPKQPAPLPKAASPVSSPTGMKSVAPPAVKPAPAPVDPFEHHSESVNLIAKCIHELLCHRADIGEADSMEALSRRISENFYAFFQMPLAVSGSTVPVDPIVVLEKFQGVLFTRMMVEPVTGGVFVKPLTEKEMGKSVAPTQVQAPSQPPTVRPIGREEVIAAGLRLRDELQKSISLLDSSLRGRRQLDIESPEIWANGLDALANDHREKCYSVISQMFPRN